jgi:hypothetical protein
MVHPEFFCEKPVLGIHHVIVSIVRKARVKPIAGLARLTVAYTVREDEEVTGRVEELSGSEKNACKVVTEELLSASACPMKNHHCIADFSCLVPDRRAYGPVMDIQLRQDFSAQEFEVPDQEIP